MQSGRRKGMGCQTRYNTSSRHHHAMEDDKTRHCTRDCILQVHTRSHCHRSQEHSWCRGPCGEPGPMGDRRPEHGTHPCGVRSQSKLTVGLGLGLRIRLGLVGAPHVKQVSCCSIIGRSVISHSFSEIRLVSAPKGGDSVRR